MQRKSGRMLTGALAVLLCLLLCAGCVASEKNAKESAKETAGKNQVYITFGTNVTTGQWELQYGAISRDGKQILPLEQQEIAVIYDEKTGEQLWLQTREQFVDDPAIEIRNLYEDHNWEHIHNDYVLYDLEGNLLQKLGERGVQQVYGDWILYSDGKLESRKNGAVLFDNVNEFYATDGYCMMNCQDYNLLRLADQELQILAERNGGYGRPQQDRVIFLQRNGKAGLLDFNGTEILPCQYDYIEWCLKGDRCMAKRGAQSFVYSAQDGRVLYETAEPNQSIYYADDDVLLLRSTVQNAAGDHEVQMQMYNYDGQAISAVYSYLYWETDSMQEEAPAVFTAQDLQGVPVVLNHHGEEVYRGLAGQWLNPLTAERIIVSDDNKTEHRATLQTLEGEVLHEKQYDGIYPVYLTAKQYPYSQKSSLVIGNYRFGETTLVDLLDADGNLLFERAKSIQALAEDRFWVEKGFSQGLMDREGNWLYQQSLFDSAVDE